MRIVDCGMRIEKGKQKNPKSAIRNDWADAFCPEAPCPRAITEGSRKCPATIQTRPHVRILFIIPGIQDLPFEKHFDPFIKQPNLKMN